MIWLMVAVVIVAVVVTTVVVLLATKTLSKAPSITLKPEQLQIHDTDPPGLISAQNRSEDFHFYPLIISGLWSCKVCGTVVNDKRLHWQHFHGETVIG